MMNGPESCAPEQSTQVHPSSWLCLCTWPLDSGWYPDVRLILTPSAIMNTCHTWDVKFGPRLSQCLHVGERDGTGPQQLGMLVEVLGEGSDNIL